MILNDAMDWNDIKGECVTHISIRNPICEQRDKSNVDEDENYHILYNHRVKCRMSQMFCTKDMPPATREGWKKKKISPYDDAQLPREGRQIMNIKFLVWRRRDVWSIVKVHTHKNEIDFCSSLVGRKTFHYIFGREKNLCDYAQSGNGGRDDFWHGIFFMFWQCHDLEDIKIRTRLKNTF